MQKERKRCVISEFQLFPKLSQNLTSVTQQIFYEYYIEGQQWETDAICVSIFVNTQMIQITEVIHILKFFSAVFAGDSHCVGLFLRHTTDRPVVHYCII